MVGSFCLKSLKVKKCPHCLDPFKEKDFIEPYLIGKKIINE